MGKGGSRQGLALFMLLLFAISTQSYYFTENTNTLEDTYDDSLYTIGQAEKLAIGSFPDGAVEKVKISVPDGQVVHGVAGFVSRSACPSGHEVHVVAWDGA